MLVLLEDLQRPVGPLLPGQDLRGLPVHVLVLGVGAEVEQFLDDLGVILAGCVVQRRAVPCVQHVGVGAVVEQQLADVGVAVQGREVQRRELVLGPDLQRVESITERAVSKKNLCFPFCGE